MISSTSSVFCEVFPYSCSYKINHFDITVTVSWKCLAIRLHYIQHPFFLVSFPGKKTNRSTPGCPNSHAVISLWNHFHPWEQTEQDLESVWLSIYYTRSVLNKGWVANLVIQHADQLHNTRVLFLSQPKLNEALATCQMKPVSTPDHADSSEDSSLLPLLEFSRLVASAASPPLLALATICTGEPALCAAQRTPPGSR